METKHWSKLKGKELANRVVGIIDGLESEQSSRRERYVRNRSAYELREMSGYGAQDYLTGTSDEGPFAMDRLHLIRSAVSHAAATIYAPQKPKPQFQTLGATWSVRRKAYRLDRICEGVLNWRQGRFINGWAAMIDAGVECSLQGLAPVKVEAEVKKKHIRLMLVPHIQLFTDPCEGREPRSLFQRSPMPITEALARWPGKSKPIEAAKTYEFMGSKASDKVQVTRAIQVDYAWALGEGDEPGLAAIVIGGDVIEAKPFKPPAFPFVFLYWEMHRDGHGGAGIADEGFGLAQDAGDIAYRLQRRAIVASGKKGYYTQGTVKPDDLAHNEEITWIPVQEGGQTPQESLVPPFSPMELDHLKERERMFWDSVGLSQVSAAARREPGLTSGLAQMTLNDTKAGRQLIKAQRYENAYVDLAHQIVWRLREIAEDDPEFVVRWPGKGLLHEEDWKEADVEDDMFTVQVAPASALPHDPAGRQEAVDRLLAMRLISPETAKTLIGWPDLDSELNMETSEGEYIDMLISKYLDAEEDTWTAADYQAPEGFIFNKVWAMRRFASAWFRARIDQQMLKDPDEKKKAEFPISLLQRYIRELDHLMAPPPLPVDQAPVAKGMEQVASAVAARQPAPVGGLGMPGAPPTPAAPQG